MVVRPVQTNWDFAAETPQWVRCRRCGRRLTSPSARRRGMGRVCAQKTAVAK
jgi:hypothetical protein